MKMRDVHYRPVDEFEMSEMLGDIEKYLRLSAEFGKTAEGAALFDDLREKMNETLSAFQKLTMEAEDPDEPDDLQTIRKLRPEGPRRLTKGIPSDYASRIAGALNGRMAGCTLGGAYEYRSVQYMKNWSEHLGDVFPPVDYWTDQQNDPKEPHYMVGIKNDLTRGHMDACPPDDDLMYTVMGLLVLEENGPEFTKEQLARTYLKYLPIGPDSYPLGMHGCWWGERVMMKNLTTGIGVDEAGFIKNPNLQNIAAWTRADSYGYVCPGWPEKAAEMAYVDASVNHRRNGVYGSMFMAAVIAAAFAVDSAEEAVRIGLTEIPEDCLLAEGIRWALEQKYSNYQEAYDLIWERYDGMFNGSALTNALQVIMGLKIADGDFTKAIGETVAMSGDNDCTGATAGSICGAMIGIEKIPEHWYRPFNGRLHSYLKNCGEYLSVEELCGRYRKLAEKFCD